MPIISMFYGIVVMMYYFDDRRHHHPHIHAECGDEEAVVSIPDGTLVEGSIRTPKQRLVQAWIEIHRDDSADQSSSATRILPSSFAC